MKPGNTGFFEKSRNRLKLDKKVVGAEGFEPPTFCSQSRRATRLRYTPIDKSSFPDRENFERVC